MTLVAWCHKLERGVECIVQCIDNLRDWLPGVCTPQAVTTFVGLLSDQNGNRVNTSLPQPFGVGQLLDDPLSCITDASKQTNTSHGCQVPNQSCHRHVLKQKLPYLRIGQELCWNSLAWKLVILD